MRFLTSPVSTHTKFGVRVVQRRDVLKIILGQAARLAVIGVVIGLAAAAELARLISKVLFGVSSTNPLTFALVAVVLTFVALAACYIPARRAMRVDPRWLCVTSSFGILLFVARQQRQLAPFPKTIDVAKTYPLQPFQLYLGRDTLIRGVFLLQRRLHRGIKGRM